VREWGGDGGRLSSSPGGDCHQMRKRGGGGVVG
jgi:hypothetical protein